jgi:hypothetical protein
MREWPGILQQLAAFEERPLSDAALAILAQYMDVKRLRAASDTLIYETIPLDVGLSMVDVAHTMLRAAGTKSRRPRAHISGHYSEQRCPPGSYGRRIACGVSLGSVDSN